MPTNFILPHINISGFRTASPYTGPKAGGSGSSRIRNEHATKILHELSAAFAEIDEGRVIDRRLDAPTGSYIEVELQANANPTAVLELKTSGIKPGAVKEIGDSRTVALYIPDNARDTYVQILKEYKEGPLTEKGQQPPNAKRVEPIEAIRRAYLSTFWTDDANALPTDPQHEMWWAIWTHIDKEISVEEVCRKLNVRIAAADRRMYFPEVVVIPVFARRVTIEIMTFVGGVVDELRRATDTPYFFIDEERENQWKWSDNLAGRIVWPGSEVAAVCILDTGINRAHALLEPALAAEDQHAIDSEWQVTDHHMHGTAMAGLALHGDLTAQLGDMSERTLVHRLESVKILSPNGFDFTNPNSYGVITQTAVSLPEITKPNRSRVFCMAITNENVSGATPSTWSAAIDQAAAGTMIGDNAKSPKRLFIIAAGNVDPIIDYNRMQSQDTYSAEDPCQAWNALTVGAYTDLIHIDDEKYKNWTPLVQAGALSPHSRTSVSWLPTKGPIKPEIVMEGGNRMLSPSANEVLTHDSLCLLSTGKDILKQPLVSFQATSAATAQAARVAAQLTSAYPEYWPETIRALMVHSAEWTEQMRAELNACSSKKEKYDIIRRFGYGVADFDRAFALAQDHLALVAQAEIQPFLLKGSRKFNECHYYNLPIPVSLLEELNNEIVHLKVTLSYFIDPNPGFSANVDPQRYQSYGLRFDLRRSGESIERFKQRVNIAERAGEVLKGSSVDDKGWMLGPNSISAGSLHCDEWSGPAIELLGRDQICIKPVVGWWRSRANSKIINSRTRYALVITIKAPSIKLYNSVQTVVDVMTANIETEIVII